MSKIVIPEDIAALARKLAGNSSLNRTWQTSAGC